MGIINEVSCHHPKITKKEDFTKSSSMCINGSCSNKEVFDKGYALLNKYNVKYSRKRNTLNKYNMNTA